MISKMQFVDDLMHTTLSGSLYVQDAKEVRETLMSVIDKGQTSFLIDMSEVDYIDGPGLGMLLSVQKIARLRGGHIRLQGVQGLVKEIFKLTRVDKAFDILQ